MSTKPLYADPLSACFAHAINAKQEGRVAPDPELEAEVALIRFEQEDDGLLAVPIRQIEDEHGGPLNRARAWALGFAHEVSVRLDVARNEEMYALTARLRREIDIRKRRVEEHEAAGCTPPCVWAAAERGIVSGLRMALGALGEDVDALDYLLTR